jgi:hypothetical protein
MAYRFGVFSSNATVGKKKEGMWCHKANFQNVSEWKENTVAIKRPVFSGLPK